MTKRKQVRKESGRIYNKFYNPEQGQYNEMHWDDWNDYRDGFRNAYQDNTLKQPSQLKTEHWSGYQSDIDVNRKISIHERIRKAMKHNGRHK